MTDTLPRRILVTGGAGFIGSALVLKLVLERGIEVLTVDAMTYAANPASLAVLNGHPGHRLVEADICDAPRMRALISDFAPGAVMHLAAESHVDRSITGPAAFVRTNVMGTQSMIDAARAYHGGLEGDAKAAFRFLHVSTDEVFGSLGPTGYFDEETRYDPRSPYSASKAASDHLVRAAGETYGLPILISNCSNNYGPRQFPEKLIPLMILNALEGKALPVYGDGQNVRDWIHVEDHAEALIGIVGKGRVGETYCVGARSERTNLQVVRALCAAMDRLRPDAGPHERLITFVADRPGHDRRYAIDSAKVEREIGWSPSRSFEAALEDTVRWYLDNERWWQPIRTGRYRGERLGLVG
ncbi:dTDP-glucose 4,6-dehydratase [Alsobacter sp. R-9]